MEYVETKEGQFPALGLGTWQLTGEQCIQSVRDAIDLGYRHIDTAQTYGNEAEVGRGIAESTVASGEVFVVTKLSDDHHDRDSVRRSVGESLEALGVEPIGLLLIHRPSSYELLGETLAAMRQTQDEGLVEHIGVSNFSPEQFDEALGQAPVVCNQVEHHPYEQHPELVAQVAERGATVVAYSPLAHGGLLSDATLAEIGEKHGKTPAQVSLRWLLDQPNVSTIPKATSRAHLEENLDVFDFSLDTDDHERIASLDRTVSPRA